MVAETAKNDVIANALLRFNIASKPFVADPLPQILQINQAIAQVIEE